MKSLIRSFRDKYLSLIIAIIIGSFYLHRYWGKSMPNSLDNLYLGGITISVGIAGFLVTSLSIIYGLQDKKIIQDLKRVKFFNKLVNCFVNAAKWHFISFILGTFGLFLDYAEPQLWHNIFFTVWLIVIVQAIGVSYRVINILQRTLTSH